MSVKVRMRVNKISQSEFWVKNPDGSFVIQTQIDMGVVKTNDPNDPNYPYAQLSAGTTFPLHTINADAAKQFEIGKDYDVMITPAE